MSFLIAEILLLLALAALLGGALVYWGVRRHFVDVSAEYERYERTMREVEELRRDKSTADARIAALESEKVQLEHRFDDESTLRKTLDTKIEALSSAVAKIRPADLGPLETRLDTIHGAVTKLKNTDVSGIAAELATTSAAVAAIKPVLTQKKLDSIHERLAALRNTDVSHIAAGVAATSAAVTAMKPADLGPVAKKLDSIDARVAALRNADLAPVDARVKSLTESVRGIETRLKSQPATDLSGVYERLDSIEHTLKTRPQATTPAPAKRRPAPRTAAPRHAATPQPRRQPTGALLKSPSYGEPDDLKQISGVGPKLEKMLHDIGVYYFFQVESWKPADVQSVDEMLKVFRGRIERDKWVKQAQTLAQQPEAASPA